jgi:hypothetical protein
LRHVLIKLFRLLQVTDLVASLTLVLLSAPLLPLQSATRACAAHSPEAIKLKASGIARKVVSGPASWYFPAGGALQKALHMSRV